MVWITYIPVSLYHAIHIIRVISLNLGLNKFDILFHSKFIKINLPSHKLQPVQALVQVRAGICNVSVWKHSTMLYWVVPEFVTFSLKAFHHVVLGLAGTHLLNAKFVMSLFVRRECVSSNVDDCFWLLSFDQFPSWNWSLYWTLIKHNDVLEMKRS